MLEAVFIDAVLVIALLALIYMSAFFSSSETSLCSISEVQLRQLLKGDPKLYTRAQAIKTLKGDMDLFITTVLVGNNFVNTLASALGTMLALRIGGAGSIVYSTLSLTILMIIAGEIIPKTLANLDAKAVALKNASILLMIQRGAYPVIWLFVKFTRFVSFLDSKLVLKRHPLVTEAELYSLIDLGQKEGQLEVEEKTMLYKIFQVSDLLVRNIMRYRGFIKGVAASASYNELLKSFCSTGYSRLPVYEKDIDNIIGVLNYKAVIFNRESGKEGEEGFARRYMSRALFVPETLSCMELLEKFKAENKNIAIAVDEHGSNSGVVTMDDILRVVMGRLCDEANNEALPPEQRLKILGAHEVIIPGDMKLSDVNSLLALNLSSQYCETLGGYVLEHLDCLPTIGMALAHEGLVFVVEDMSRRCIVTVHLYLKHRSILPIQG